MIKKSPPANIVGPEACIFYYSRVSFLVLCEATYYDAKGSKDYGVFV